MADKKKDKKEEIYNYENKRLSRVEIYNYIKEKQLKFNLKPFEQLKLLILSHHEGRDLKEIYFPLGIKPKNIMVIDKDSEVIKRMRLNPVFKGINIIESDLNEYILLELFNSSDLFDIYHLDFKSNLHKKLWETIIFPLLFIIQNYHFTGQYYPSIFYINVYGARERPETTKEFKKIKQNLKVLEKSHKVKLKRTRTKVQKGIETPKKLSHQYFKHHEAVSRYIHTTELLKTTNDVFKEDNRHHFRADYIYFMVKSFLSSHILRSLSVNNLISYQKSENDDFRIAEKTRHHYNTSSYLHYITNTLQIFDYYVFKYLSRDNNPFISALFV
jgi:hypothetical protein